jgi:hypothetical protein
MRPLLLPLFGLALVGCTQQVAPSADQADVETNSSTVAVVGIERTTGSEGTTAETVARFIRMRGYPTSDEALRAVGVTIESPAPGTCITFAPPDAAPAAQLIDVGAVTVEANRLETRLIARQLPDVGDVVTGVGYGRTADADALPAGASYVIRVAGSRDYDVPAFDAMATAPADPEVRIAGQDARGGVVLEPDQAAIVTWDPGRAEDTIYIDVAPKQTALAPMAAVVRCAFPDSGYAELAGSLLGAPEGVIRVHRHRREAFRARGVDIGEMRFDFTHVAAFVMAPRAEAPVLR